VEISLPQARLPQLQALLSATSTPPPVLAYASTGGALLAEGRLVLIDNRVSSGTGTIRVKAEFANPQGKLWPDQSVAVSVQSQLLNDVLVVPQTVVQRGLSGDFIYRVQGDKAEVVPVQITYSDNDIAVITGANAGDKAVVDGQSRLRPGAKVRLLDAAAAQGATP
jgi:RND family efflux transporter MFP subunit